MENENFSERQSLQLITNMIQKAKHSFHENGTSAILWGSVVNMPTKSDVSLNVLCSTIVFRFDAPVLVKQEEEERKQRYKDWTIGGH